MLAPPDSTPDTMIAALTDSMYALDAASELDLDRSAAAGEANDVEIMNAPEA